MLGVLVNTGSIIVCTILGLLFKKLLKKSIIDVVMQALGIAVIVVGILDAIKVKDAGSSNAVLLLVCSLAVGTAIGATCHLQKGIEKFGDFIESKYRVFSDKLREKKAIKKNVDVETLKVSESGDIGQAFVSASLVFCIGAMVVYGSIQSGLGQPTTLYIKSILDGVFSLLLATAMGWGVMLSAIPVFIIQGAFALSASSLAQYATPEFMNMLSAIGGTLVMCIGINILGIKKINTADMLPAIFGSLLIFVI